MKLLLLILLPAIMVLTVTAAHGQRDSSLQKASLFIKGVPARLLKGTEAKYRNLNDKLSRSNERYLAHMQKQEEKLARKLARKDSSAAKELLASSRKKYEQLRQQLSHPGGTALTQYVPGLDSVQTFFKFLDKPGLAIPGISPAKIAEIKSINNQLKGLQDQLQQTTNIKNFLKERKQFLADQLGKFGMGNSLQRINKEVYYYQAQVNEYKAILNDPDKLQRKALQLVQGSALFKDFMARNSQLAQLFSVPGSGGQTAPSLAGLQTLASVQQQMAAGMAGSSGVNPSAVIQQQAQAAQAELNKLKDKINKLGGSGSDEPMPEFRPNQQKTKSFWKRVELGLNIQSQKVNALLPTTSDIVLTAGYKLNDKSTIGIGAGYKLGWGKDIRHIRLSSQGISLRSFMDIKIKGNWWISGGYEGNYQHEFTKIEELKDINAWQRSGLIGMIKKYRIGKKTGNLQLLWDFLSYEQVPRTQPLKFRLGYTL